MRIGIDTTQLSVFADHMKVSAGRAPQVARAKVIRNGHRLLADIRHRASGRPGPRVITRRYVDSLRLEIDTDTRGNPRATAGTDHPAGFRLERGFHGTDTRGRHFVFADGHPHVAPAAAVAQDPLDSAAAEIFDDL